MGAWCHSPRPRRPHTAEPVDGAWRWTPVDGRLSRSSGRGHDGAVSRNLGSSRVHPSTPTAVRATRPGWRDPRLWVGVLIVAVSVVAGARVLAAADDTVAVWAVAADAGPGAALTEA